MADPKLPEEKEPVVAAAPEPPEVKCFAAYVLHKDEPDDPGKPCICLFATEEDAKKKATTGKCVDVCPGHWAGKEPVFPESKHDFTILSHAVDNWAK